jgi:hypothetical protein
MKTTSIRLAAAAMGCLAGGAIAAAPITSAIASPHGAQAPAGHHHHHKVVHPKGFFVGNRDGHVQKVESYGTPSALVRDSNGREHLVTTQPSKADPTMGHLVYLTRDTDTSAWKAHAVPGLRDLTGGVQVEAHLSFFGKRIFAVLYECDGVFVADAPVGASRLPLPQEVVSADNCASPPASSNNPPVQLAGNTYGRNVGILLPGLLPGSYAIYSGTPGPDATFTAGTPLPTTDSFVPKFLAIDPVSQDIIVVGTGSDGTNVGIYEVKQTGGGGSWSEPNEIASLGSATADYKIQALQTYARHIYVGLLKPSGGKHLKHSLYLVKIQPSGQTLGSVPLPHSNGNDHYLRLVVNPATRHLHAAWTRIIAGKPGSANNGLMHEAQGSSGWNKATYITHWYRDVPTQITLTKKYHPIIGFDQH